MNASEAPLVSVIVEGYSEVLLPTSVGDSIAGLLEQDYPLGRIELVLIGSTDQQSARRGGYAAGELPFHRVVTVDADGLLQLGPPDLRLRRPSHTTPRGGSIFDRHHGSNFNRPRQIVRGPRRAFFKFLRSKVNSSTAKASRGCPTSARLALAGLFRSSRRASALPATRDPQGPLRFVSADVEARLEHERSCWTPGCAQGA